MYEMAMMISFHIPSLTDLHNGKNRDQSQFNTYLHLFGLISKVNKAVQSFFVTFEQSTNMAALHIINLGTISIGIFLRHLETSRELSAEAVW